MSASTLDVATAPPAIAAWQREAAARVEAQLEARLLVPAHDPGRLREAMRYAALGPGKRLRPMLVYASADAVGGASTAAGVDAAAAAIEMLHAYTLVHDDLPAMDDDSLRRGRPTVHVVFGEAIAILAGDALLTEAFAALATLGAGAAGADRAVACLARRAGAAELLAGQALDLAAKKEAPSLAELERMHAAKTGALFAAACELGAIAAGAAPEVGAILGKFGESVGVAFQFCDDRDDNEFAALAAQAGQRGREYCAQADALIANMPAAGRLREFSQWIAARLA